ncbi:PHF7 protein, partial [Nothoprocta ornata]|nr:PHF7 protein [Nothoprocta ornata]
LCTELSRSSQSCFACGERGATIDCQGKKCGCSFHLPCAAENNCVTQFYKNHRSYCPEHRPKQTVPVSPDADTICIICFEAVEEKLSFGTMVCPSCRGTWFHRGCIQVGGFPCPAACPGPGHSSPLTNTAWVSPQGLATSAGRECFRCPQCSNKEKFLSEMLKMGIHVPFRTPAWEEDGRYDDMDYRHSQCDAERCLFHGGRQQVEQSGPWELVLCSSCAAKGTHQRCSSVHMSTGTWECNECAGMGLGKRQ